MPDADIINVGNYTATITIPAPNANYEEKVLTVEKLSEHIKRLEDSGVHNINLVSPTPYIESIVECFVVVPSAIKKA